MNRKQIFIAAILSSFIYTSCSSGTKNKDLTTRTIDDDKADSLLLVYDERKADPFIADFTYNLHKKYGFNGNVLVAKKGKILFEKSYGWANYLKRDSLHLDSQFELASITKTFTGVAVMQLIEQKKLSLDDNVTKFFPDFPYENISIKLLLTHRSGLMNYVYFTDNLWKDKKKGMSNMDAMDLIIKHKPAPYTKPDVKFHYNNSNFMILGAIIEKVTGKSYAEYVEEKIFKPAGMKNTHAYSTVKYPKIPVDVIGHDKTWRYSVVQNFHDGPLGDKGIYSTLNDLVLYDKALKNGRLLTQNSLDSMYIGRSPLEKGHFNYGYGWRTFEAPNQHVVYHTGWWHGFRNIYVRDLKNDIVVIFLGNLTNGSLQRLDDLYKYLKMPIIRRGAYNNSGQSASTDID